MFLFLGFVSNGAYWKIHSRIIAFFLKRMGIHVGKNFYIAGVPKLYIRGQAKNIHIGNNVSIFGNIDIRNRHEGRIVIDDEVSIEQDCRLVTANNATLHIGSGCGIGPFCMFNCGADVTLGRNCLLAGMVHIQSSDHCFTDPDKLIKDQGYSYGAVQVGNDAWLAVGATLLRDVRLEDGCVVAARAVVRRGCYAAGSVLAGVPAKVIGQRGEAREMV